jgi:serine/threonine protein kinase
MPNTTCTRCSRPMAPPVAGELCETCRRHDTVAPFLRAPGDTPFLMTPAVDPDPIAPTQRIGRAELPPPVLPGYDLRDTLGGGGMGVVYLAYEVDADRLVALKFVRAAADPAARERFRVEVQAMARLDHPNVVRVYAVELDRPDPFFTMEPVDGPGLDRRLLRDGPLPAAEAARIMERVARAVQHAHDEGVVHRDLKPGNVIVGSDGVPKVTDFGLAKRTDAADGLTVWDAVLGTPGFMAPEQTGGRNEEVGPPADVYGLGSTLYALLTGQAPFSGTDPVEVAVRVRTRPPRPVSELRRDVPVELEAVVLKCLQKDPAKRYASAGEMADDLARWLRGERTQVRPPSRVVRLGRAVRRRRSAVMAGLVPFLALFFVSGGNPVAERARKPIILVGATGMPRFDTQFINTRGTIRKTEDGICELRTTKGTSLLQLSQAPEVQWYRYSAEFRSTDTAAVESSRVGLYFGHHAGLSEKGIPVHSCFSVTCSTCNSTASIERVVLSPNPRPEQPARFAESTQGIGHTKFKNDPHNPSPWRWLAVEVTRTGIRALIRDTPDGREVTLAWIPTEEIGLSGTKLQNDLDGREKLGRKVGPWHPGQPVGIYCRDAVISVRNAILEPLPE